MSPNVSSMKNLPNLPRTADEAKARLSELRRRIDAYPQKTVWIHLFSPQQIDNQLERAFQRHAAGITQPLLGLSFAIKDNIDFADAPTTAGCREFAYSPQRSATVVSGLCDAGAIVLGKTNLDQFATGLVGTRSPYGIVKNPFNSA